MSTEQSNKPIEKWWQAEDLQCIWRHFSGRFVVLAIAGAVVMAIVLIQEWLAGIR